jgi:hypothetical protein
MRRTILLLAATVVAGFLVSMAVSERQARAQTVDDGARLQGTITWTIDEHTYNNGGEYLNSKTGKMYVSLKRGSVPWSVPGEPSTLPTWVDDGTSRIIDAQSKVHNYGSDSTGTCTMDESASLTDTLYSEYLKAYIAGGTSPVTEGEPPVLHLDPARWYYPTNPSDDEAFLFPPLTDIRVGPNATSTASGDTIYGCYPPQVVDLLPDHRSPSPYVGHITNSSSPLPTIDFAFERHWTDPYGSGSVSDATVTGKLIPNNSLAVTASPSPACQNQNVTFTTDPVTNANWSGGGTPASGTGTTFTTRFNTPGDHTVTAQTPDGRSSASATVHVAELSGAAWVNRFPNSRDTADLAEPFRTNANNFLAALRGAGLVDATGMANPPANSYRITTTRRSAERAWLMHYAWRIARDRDILPQNVPEREGIDICWAHRNADGSVNQRASLAAAEDMVRGYGMAARAALNSNHIRGEAIDVTIQWRGDITVRNGNNQPVLINTRPRSGGDGNCGEGNALLRAVGLTYNVRKLVDCADPDPPHWSIDGH